MTGVAECRVRAVVAAPFTAQSLHSLGRGAGHSGGEVS
jgi:hypothetical protein